MALALPSYDHSVTTSRELVTKDRPFSPTLVYMTNATLLPLGAAWLGALFLLIAAHRVELRSLWQRIRRRVSRGPATGDLSAPPPAPVV